MDFTENKTEDIEKDEKIESATKTLLDWVEQNNPDKVEQASKKISEITLEQSDERNSYDATKNILSYTERAEEQTLIHELVHAVSTQKNEDYFSSRTGVIPLAFGGGQSFANQANESLTELSTLVIQKGSSYIVETDIEELFKYYESSSIAERGYIHSTQFFLKKIKENNLNESEINEIVNSLLFDKREPAEILEEIEEKLKVDDLIGDLGEYLRKKGREEVSSAWDFIKKTTPAEFWEEKKVKLDGKIISTKELFHPLEFSIEFGTMVKFLWLIDKYEESNLRDLYKRMGIDQRDYIIDANFVHELMKRKDNPEALKYLQMTFTRAAVSLYRELNSDKKE